MVCTMQAPPSVVSTATNTERNFPKDLVAVVCWYYTSLGRDYTQVPFEELFATANQLIEILREIHSEGLLSEPTDPASPDLYSVFLVKIADRGMAIPPN